MKCEECPFREFDAEWSDYKCNLLGEWYESITEMQAACPTGRFYKIPERCMDIDKRSSCQFAICTKDDNNVCTNYRKILDKLNSKPSFCKDEWIVRF